MSDTSTQNTGAPSPLLLSALEKILKPLVKLMLSSQITYPILAAMLKGIFVDVAETEFQNKDKRQSDSRINLLTGVHRKDVKRLRSETKTERSTPASVSTGAKLIAYWLGNAEYLDANDKPRPLTIKGSDGKPSDFEQLVESVCKQDIRPRVILDEWLRLGVAHIEGDQLILNTGAFTPDKGYEEKAFFFGKNIQDHILAGSHNLLGQEPSYFDRSVYYDQLTLSSVDELNQLADKLGMQALTAMNKEALARQKRDRGKDANQRMNFGVFNFNTLLDKEESQQSNSNEES